jgi:hypothetical protein
MLGVKLSRKLQMVQMVQPESLSLFLFNWVFLYLSKKPVCNTQYCLIVVLLDY